MGEQRCDQGVGGVLHLLLSPFTVAPFPDCRMEVVRSPVVSLRTLSGMDEPWEWG